MATFVLTPNIPDLPDGWQGTPNQLIAFIRDNTTWQVTDFPPPVSTGAVQTTTTTTPTVTDGGTTPVVSTPDTNVYVPLGAIILWPFETIPSNFLECNGQALDPTKYPDFFGVYGGITQYNYPGPDLPPTQFRLPDLRGRFPMGASAGVGGYAYPFTHPTMLLRSLSYGQYVGNVFPVPVNSPLSNGSSWPSQPYWSTGVPAVKFNWSNSTYKAVAGSQVLWDNTPPALTLKFIIRVL